MEHQQALFFSLSRQEVGSGLAGSSCTLHRELSFSLYYTLFVTSGVDIQVCGGGQHLWDEKVAAEQQRREGMTADRWSLCNNELYPPCLFALISAIAFPTVCELCSLAV